MARRSVEVNSTVSARARRIGNGSATTRQAAHAGIVRSGPSRTFADFSETSWLTAIAFALMSVLLVSCSAPVGTLFYGTLAKGEAVVILASGATNGPQAVVAYDTSGNFLENLADLTGANLTPLGLAPKDGFNFVAALGQAAASADLVSFATTGGYSTFVNNTNLNGQIYQIGYDANSKTYMAVKGTGTISIEAFDTRGSRVGNPFIATTVGACTLTSPRTMTIDPVNKKLWITNIAATIGLFVYDISNMTAPTCVTKNVSMGATAPYPVLYHHTGFVYSVAQTPRSIFAFPANSPTTAGVAVFTDASNAVLTASTAMAEMPDGTILIANSVDQ